MQNVEWPWPIACLLAGKSWKLVLRSMATEWIFTPLTMTQMIFQAVQMCGLFACMEWVIKSAEVSLVFDDSVLWYPDDSAWELYTFSDHRSDHKYWPWGKSAKLAKNG
jgi:hypothetical protein